jgi:protein tyrosine/serine phosphatase
MKRTTHRLTMFGVSLLSLVLGVGLYLGYLQLSGNIHTVIANQVYRSEHLSVKHLKQVVQEKSIQTILDLSPIDNLKDEEAMASQNQVTYLYFPLQAMGMTSFRDLKQLTDIIRGAKKPLLIHCKSGSDRTGLASAVALILDDRSVSQAMQQVEFVRYGIMNDQSTGRVTLKPYVTWLQKNNLQSSRLAFLQWLSVSS